MLPFPEAHRASVVGAYRNLVATSRLVATLDGFVVWLQSPTSWTFKMVGATVRHLFTALAPVPSFHGSISLLPPKARRARDAVAVRNLVTTCLDLMALARSAIWLSPPACWAGIVTAPV